MRASIGVGLLGLCLSGCAFQTDKEASSSSGTNGNNGGGGDNGGGCDKCCHPLTCAAAGANCGVIADGCGGFLGCGGCAQGETCGGGGVANVCGNPCEQDELMCDDRCVPILTDLLNCGGCGVVCDLPNAVAECEKGKCAVQACDPCFADCDCNPNNGCETDVTRDPDNCGGCGLSCRLPNAVTACDDGKCEITTCKPEFADCDGDPSNGCEANLDFDRDNCGECGFDCAVNQDCVEGHCVSPTPPPVDAGAPPPDLARPHDLATARDLGSCIPGTCDDHCPCPTGQRCQNFLCTGPLPDGGAPDLLALTDAGCPVGEVRCPTGCTNTLGDILNCGGCGTICTAGMLCLGGVCATMVP